MSNNEQKDENALIAERRRKLDALREEGNPFPNDFRRNALADELHRSYGKHEDEHLREDARMALERIPIQRAVQALKAGFEIAPEDFKPNLAQSLRKRGVKVEGYPCVKLVPTK